MHKCNCEHESLEYCDGCGRVICSACGKEWVEDKITLYDTVIPTPSTVTDGGYYIYTDTNYHTH